MFAKSRKRTKSSPPSITGKLLLALPSMQDPRFERAVILMCAYDESGAMGLRVNEALPDVGFQKIVEQTGIKSEIAINLEAVDVFNGGPVDSSRGFLLHSGEYKQKDTIRVSPDYAVSGTLEALKEVVEGNGPGQMIFVLGHAGWTAGQLDQELQDNAWLVVDATPDLVFNTPCDQKWEAALSALGIDPVRLSSQSGHA